MSKQPTMTPIQRRILWLMRTLDEDFVAATTTGARKLGFGHWLAEEGGLVVRVYGESEYFMRSRGWLEQVERNARGRWYRITDEGRAVAATILTEPKAWAETKADIELIDPMTFAEAKACGPEK